MIKIGVLGSTGKTGKEIVKKILQNSKCFLSGAASHPCNSFIGKDIGQAIGIQPQNIILSDNLDQIFKNSDVIIDFSSSKATHNHIQYALKFKKPIVLGTTNLDDKHYQFITESSSKIPILLSSNMSTGITLLTSIVEQLAKQLDDDFDIEIFDFHHRFKLDAPSGTALTLGKAIAKSKGIPFKDCAILSRTDIQTPRKSNEIGFSSARGGGIIGDHSVSFTSQNECITLSHRALNRKIYADGAIKASMWLVDKKPNLYSMKDVLGVKNI